MKYIMIYEAFRSEVVSKLNKFLVKKIGKEQSTSFIRELKSIQKTFNFPISEIKDEDVKYLSAKKSVQIKAPKDWSPSSDNISYGIYAFKFWFSLERGFLGQSGIGSKEIEYENDNDNGKNKAFSNEQLNYIKNELGITKGELEPVKDYSVLKNGQEVIGFFNSELNLKFLSKAKIFVEGSRLFAIQNVANGVEPSGNNWREWGSISWSLGSYDGIVNDHKKLHIYKKTEKELHIKGGNEQDKEENPLNWNLPVDGTHLKNWKYYDKSVVEDADFCIVFYIDNVIKRGYKKFSGYKTERKENRKGATALYTDEQIKNINIDRYMSTLINSMGISTKTEISELNSLERVIKIAICGKYPIYSLFSADAEIFIKRFSNDLRNVIRYKGDDYEFTNLKNRFMRVKRDNSNYIKSYQKSEKIIFDSENKDLIDIFNKIKLINDKVTKYINEQNIKTLSDLNSVYFKLKYIMNILDDDQIGDLSIIGMIRNMYDIYDIKGYIEYYRDKHYIVEDIDKLNNIERYIDSILN